MEAGVSSAPQKNDKTVAITNAIYPHMAWWFEIEIVDWKDRMNAQRGFGLFTTKRTKYHEG